MKNLFQITFLVLLFASCNKSKITEGDKPEDGANGTKVLVSIDQKSCITPWGETIMSGESRKAYKKNKTASCQETCESVSADLSCNDGVLSNAEAYLYNVCEKPKCDCDVNFLSQPVKLKHGDYIKLYTKSTSQCESCSNFEVQRQCVDGVLTGDANAKSQSCATVACQDCVIDASTVVKHGETKDFFKSLKGTSCDPNSRCESSAIKQNRKCLNGVLTGDANFNKTSCVNELCSCKVQNVTFSSGAAVTYYKNAISKCSDTFNCQDPVNKVVSTCNDGVIAGLAQGATVYSACTPEACSCNFKDANGVQVSILNGQSKVVYSKSNVACGMSCNSVAGSVTCDRGVLKGNTDYVLSCSTDPCTCKFGNNLLNDGDIKEVYSNPKPACGNTCAAAKVGAVKCVKGAISTVSGTVGAYTDVTCGEQTCDCMYTDIDNKIQTIANGVSATVFSGGTAACGSLCTAMQGSVTCNNTVLTGQTSYKASKCVQQNCECTAPNGSKYLAYGTIVPANKVLFYKQDKTSCGEIKCALIPNLSRELYCLKNGATTYWADAQNNTVSDFSVYKYMSCQDPPSGCSCNIAGKETIKENTTANFYKTSSVPCGMVCETPDNYISIKCNADLTTTSTPASTNIPLFFAGAYSKSCKPADCPQGTPSSPPAISDGTGDGQKGDGGGTGGGTGDGEGPGIGFAGRASGGGGGGGGARTKIYLGSATKARRATPCVLPWGGVVTDAASVVAFKVSVAPQGHKCSEYRVYRICLNGTLNGDTSATSVDCQESQ